MGVLDIIEKLQKKPESFRRKIAVLGAIFITAALLFVWLAALNFYSKRAEKEKTASGLALTPSELAPFSVLAGNFKEAGGFIKEIFSLIKNVSP